MTKKASATGKPRGRPPTGGAKKAAAKVAADMTNGNAAFETLSKAVFDAEDEKAALFAHYHNLCKDPADKKKRAFQVAKDAGLNIEGAKLALKLMTYDRKKEKAHANAEPDILALAVAMARKQLGAFADTALGRAHLAQIEQEGWGSLAKLAAEGDGEFSDDPRTKADHDAAEANAAALEGIKQLEEPAQTVQ